MHATCLDHPVLDMVIQMFFHEESAYEAFYYVIFAIILLIPLS
jgi:hypothetical protein